VERDLGDLTLAEKIKLEHQLNQSRQSSLATASKAAPAEKSKPTSQPAPPITDELYPPLAPGLALFKSAPTSRPSASGTPKSAPKHSSQIGSWETALSATGLEDSRKKKKKGSGLTVVKPRSPVMAAVPAAFAVGAQEPNQPPPPPPPPPPPGFGDMVPAGKLHRDQVEGQGGSEVGSTAQREMKFDPSDYPSLSGGGKTAAGAVTSKSAPSWGPTALAPKAAAHVSRNSLKPTEVSNGEFPGSWVSIGGSRGAAVGEKQAALRENLLIADDDFPSLGGGSGASNKKTHKKKAKASASKDLQSLAFGSK
jgi:hypothetical protein